MRKIIELIKRYWSEEPQPVEISEQEAIRPSFQGGHHFLDHVGNIEFHVYKRPK